MKAGFVVVLAAAFGLMTACVHAPSPYLSNDDPRGTPADRTGGARDVPWLHGGGPITDFPPPTAPPPGSKQ